jgi:hypothetical protein
VPTFAVLFTPFNLIQPGILGEIIWRLFEFGLFGLGLWKLAGVLNAEHGQSQSTSTVFLWMVLSAVPASLASINNGQTNLLLSAVLTLGVLALRDQKWRLAAFLLTLAVILKPIALAPFLLAFAVFGQTRRFLVSGAFLGIAIGFIHPDLNYSWHQATGFLHKLLGSYTPEHLRVSDLFGALQKWGIEIPSELEKASRAIASFAALGFVWSKAKRGGVSGGSWGIWVAAALVLTIFNPRVETNSYVIISPLLACAAVSYWRKTGGVRWKGAILAIACVGLMCDGMGKTIYLATDVWLKPVIVLAVSPLLFRMPDRWKPTS